MYIFLVFLAAIVFSAGVVSRGVQMGINTFRVAGIGTLYGALGCLIIVAMSSLLGNGIGSQITQNIDLMSGMLAENAEYAQIFGLDGMSSSEITDFYRQMYSQMAMMLPAVFIIWSGIISYTECAVSSRIIRRKNPEAKGIAPIREFSISRAGLIGWVVISLAAWLLNYADLFSFAETVNVNIYLLFRAVFALQGISLIAYIFHMRGWPKVLCVILILILMVSGIGSTVLYVAGIADALVNLKSKIGVRV